MEAADDGSLRLSGNFDVHEAAELAIEIQDRLKLGRRKRIEQMQEYAEISTCRREYLLRYFGDTFTGPCGNCDNDHAGSDNGSAAGAGTRREVSGG